MDRIVDKNWFHTRFKEADISQRSVAARLDINHASLSQTMAGRRRPQLEEVIALTEITGASIHEVVRRLGYRLTPRSGEKTVPVAGYVDEGGTVILGPVEAPKSVPAPIDEEGLTVVRIQADGWWRGWHVMYREAPVVDPYAIGTLAVVRTLDKPEERLLRHVDRGTDRGNYDLRPWPAESPRFTRNVPLLSASPVLWLRG